MKTEDQIAPETQDRTMECTVCGAAKHVNEFDCCDICTECSDLRSLDISSARLLVAARGLFKTGHKASPFMVLDAGPAGCVLSMKFKTLDDGQAVHSALVRFFMAHSRFDPA